VVDVLVLVRVVVVWVVEVAVAVVVVWVVVVPVLVVLVKVWVVVVRVVVVLVVVVAVTDVVVLLVVVVRVVVDVVVIHESQSTGQLSTTPSPMMGLEQSWARNSLQSDGSCAPLQVSSLSVVGFESSVGAGGAHVPHNTGHSTFVTSATASNGELHNCTWPAQVTLSGAPLQSSSEDTP
jgi:hypothetical protein